MIELEFSEIAARILNRSDFEPNLLNRAVRVFTSEHLPLLSTLLDSDDLGVVGDGL